MPSRSLHHLLHVLIACTILLSQFALPAGTAALPAPNHPLGAPSGTLAEASYARRSGEPRDTYFERMATADPERYHAAALQTLQDALNGRIAGDSDEALLATLERYLSLPPSAWAAHSVAPVATGVPHRASSPGPAHSHARLRRRRPVSLSKEL